MQEGKAARRQVIKTRVKKRIDDHAVGYKEKTFLNIWENWGKPFSKHYRIQDYEFWNTFWDHCPYTQKELYLALRNIYHSVKKGFYEQRFILADPGKFIQAGMIDRVLSDQMKLWYTGTDDDPNLKNMRDD